MASNSMKTTALRTLRTKLTSATKPTFSPILAKNRGITGTTRKSTSLDSTTSSQPRTPFLPRDFDGSFPVSFSKPRPATTSSFNALINSLTTSLTTTSSPHLPTLTRLLHSYDSSSLSDWQKYAHANPNKQYTRNLVAEVPGIFNLLMLVWTPGKESKVHDHAASHCLMKIMKGELKETRWVTPEGGARTAEEMDVEGVRKYRRGKVAYMCDDLGLHSIANPSATEYAISLHLYTPPNAAMHGCHIFDPLTGVKTHVAPGAYDSVGGVVNPSA
ncbi:uncharacterized protein EAE98_010219 [Botrytis deweyae]|uniref:Cysteine dioxygenase n=1 Tax=Botrytis deweyae TaxID=2478750 RepID=A0ABQ7I9I7_9HELO|nr:uncharacterized protein EAE98_010219 [Botrytis deweyae]KAF7917456.1 hypothetical protein EAE98_010219 [Botrytis deweyae]